MSACACCRRDSAPRRGRHGALIHHEAVNQVLRPRKGARLTAITSGGAIPDNADYRVLLEPEGISVGTVNEDFAVESLQGDIFQLGNTSYRILRVERGTVRVEDAHGQPPSIPFWHGRGTGGPPSSCQGQSRGCARRSRGGSIRWRRNAQYPRSIPMAHRRRRPRRIRRRTAGRLSRGGDARRSRHYRRWIRLFSNASSMNRAACSWSFIPPSAAA